ncbi:MAG: Panacea domain-containing protein [Methanomassiliicoccaceae archaeon]|nr:Panacea domain-containing protein [Methanomassiliicoccaceae archaeon]
MQKFERMLHYIITRCGEKENVGQKELCIICYFCDFDHYERSFRSITGKNYIKTPHGPIPFGLEGSFDKLERNEMIEKATKQCEGFRHCCYRSLKDPDMGRFLPAEIDSMESAIERYGCMTGAEIEEILHKDVPWLVAKDGDPIDYGTAMYRDPGTSVDPGTVDD